MEAVAVLGVAAAAGQFAEHGLTAAKKLHSTISAIKSAPKTIASHLELINQLLSVFQLVIDRPSLQTTAVATQLEAGLRCIEDLQEILQGRGSKPDKWAKWSQAFWVVMREKDIESLFGKLERQKMDLILCVQTINLWVAAQSSRFEVRAC
jgi:hypothetical protein